MKILLSIIISLFLVGCTSMSKQFTGNWQLKEYPQSSLSIEYTGMGGYEIATMSVSGQCGVGQVMRAYQSGQRLMGKPNAEDAQEMDFPELFIEPETGNLIVQYASGQVETYVKRP